MMAERPKRAPIVERARWFQMTEAASVGIEIAAAVGVGAGLGLYLQRNVTHWAPWTLYIGLGIGIGAAAYAVVRTARNFTRVLEAEEAAERQSSRPSGPDPSSRPSGSEHSAQAHVSPPGDQDDP